MFLYLSVCDICIYQTHNSHGFSRLAAAERGHMREPHEKNYYFNTCLSRALLTGNNTPKVLGRAQETMLLLRFNHVLYNAFVRWLTFDTVITIT